MRIVLVAVSLLSCLATADGQSFDAVTGTDPRQYATSPNVKYHHLSLVIDMSDPLSKSFTAFETLTFRTAAEPIDSLTLDAVGLQISRVTDLDDKPLDFRQDDQTVTVRFETRLPADRVSGFHFAYRCSHPKKGMIFTLPDAGYPDRPISIHTQGECLSNRYWFIAHDEPNAKLTSEITVTIPQQLKALSNGALVSQDSPASGKVRFHYAMQHPQASYLISLTVGDFEVTRDHWHDRPVEYWLPPALAGDEARTFGKTPRMIDLFSKLIGVDYPWEKYAQAVVYNFEAGGMENTSCTTLTETAALSEKGSLDADEESLVAHELAHQWFGDLVTCKSWEHIWLNEGFATFMDWIWQEHEHGESAYMQHVCGTMRGVAAGDDATARSGVVWPYYDDPDQTFSRSVSNPYSKGASVLHMLRRSLGEDVFWKCLGEYLRRYQYQSVETDDLRKVIDDVTGRSYQRFFQQWIYRAGSPHLTVKYSWDEAQQTAKVSFEQTQTITADAPAFDVDIPVWFTLANGKLEKLTTHLAGRFGNLQLRQEREPIAVDIDPDAQVLADWSIDLPTSMLLRSLAAGPTPASRLTAIHVAADKDDDSIRDALKNVLSNEQTDRVYRIAAADALGRMQQSSARDDLLATFGALKDHRVRAATLENIGRYRSDQVAALLLSHAINDAAFTVQDAAIRGLANQSSTESMINALLADATKPSDRDQLRKSSVWALARLGDERVVEPAMKLATYGQPFRTRPAGIDALGRIGAILSEEKRRPVREFLIELLNDPVENVQYAAARALGETGDEKAVDALHRFADGSAPKAARDVARGALDAIHKHSGEPQNLVDLRERVDTLEKSRERIEKQLDHEQKGLSTSQPATREATP